MDDMTPQVFEKIGGMDARITNLEKRLESVDSKVDTLLERSAQSSGGKSAILTIGGGGATVGGLIVAVAQWLGLGAQPQHVSETRTETSTIRESVPAPVHNP